MSRTDLVRTAVLVLATCLATRAAADSFASSASSAGSESSGSSSTSLHGSSNSASSRRGENVDYRIVAIDDAIDHPGHARLTLQAENDGERLMLDVPQAVAMREAFGPGDVVTARKRVYGWAFARGGVQDPFFLVIADDWQTRFAPRRVS